MGSNEVRRFLVDVYKPREPKVYDSLLKWKLAPSTSVLATANSQTIGHVAVLPTTFCFKSSPVPSGWPVDMFVLPEWRRRGIGESLQRIVHDISPKLVSIWMSTSNSRLKQRIGAVPIGEFFILNRALHSYLQKGYFQPQIASLELLHSNVTAVLQNVELFANRTIDFMRWKFLMQPANVYRFLKTDHGIAVVRRCAYERDKWGMIGDTWAIDKSSAVPLLEKACMYLAMCNCEYVMFGTANTALVSDLTRSGWWHQWHSLTLSRYASFGSARSVFFSLSDQDMDQYPG